MTEEAILVRVDGPRGGIGRTYVRPATGQVVYSVTTVVSLTPKPYLMNWVVKLAAEWAAANVMDLYQLAYEDRVDAIKAATRLLREEGATKGTALHDYAEQYAWIGVVNPPQTRPERAVVAIIDLLKPEVLFNESMVWNGTIGYAGTLDGVWRVLWEGVWETWLIDWKTSKSRSAEWAIQQKAYAMAETIIDATGEHPMPHIDRTVILWVPYDEPWSIVPVDATLHEWEAFLAARRFLAWTQDRRIGDVFGDPLASGE